VKIEDIKTEIFFFPSTQIAEYGRQLHEHAADAAVAFLRRQGAGGLPHRQLVLPQPGQAAQEGVRGFEAAARPGLEQPELGLRPDAGEQPLYPGEISARKVLREINGIRRPTRSSTSRGSAS